MAEQGLLSGTPSELDTLLVRNHDSVHVRTCARVARIRVLPWRWAEGKSRAEIASARANGLRFCRSCDPLLAVPTSHDSGLAVTEETERG